ncbi:MAG: HEAT repeat domain-containing protein [Gemmatimonadales bacterium]
MTRSPADTPLPPQQVEELLRTIAKAVRAFQMYLPNNPIYQRSVDALRAAFLPIWSNLPELIVKVVETDLMWDDHVVYHQPTKSESLAWLLYKDGLRVLTLRPGCEEEELPVFLQTVVRAKLLSADAGDDLLTLLWEYDFTLIDYRFAEIITDTLAVLDPQAIDMGAGVDPYQQTQTQQKVRDELGTIMPGGVDLDEFDSTLYFLDEAEINSLKKQVDDEYQADIRTAALAAILDTFELQPNSAIREEVIGLIESVFPNLLNRGEFRTVAWLLREMRLIGSRAAAIDSGVKAKLDSFETRLSEPGLLAQMLQVVDEAVGEAQDDDMAELLKELRVPALEPLAAHLPMVKNERARRILQEAADRIARGHVEDLVKLLRNKASPGLVGAVRVAQRLQLQPTVAPVGELVGHESPDVRLAAVEALGGIGTPGALTLLERGIDDAERTVRLAAVTIAAGRGYKGALKRLEAVVQGKGPRELERAERRQFFEAYATIAGPGGLALLGEILEPKGLFKRKESPETRTCAAYAIAKIRTAEARGYLERAANDKELSIRNAAARALREWDG